MRLEETDLSSPNAYADNIRQGIGKGYGPKDGSGTGERPQDGSGYGRGSGTEECPHNGTGIGQKDVPKSQ